MSRLLCLAAGVLAGLATVRKATRLRVAHLERRLQRAHLDLEAERLHGAVVEQRFRQLLDVPAYVRKVNGVSFTVTTEAESRTIAPARLRENRVAIAKTLATTWQGLHSDRR